MMLVGTVAAASAIIFVTAAPTQDRTAYDRGMNSAADAIIDCYDKALSASDDGKSGAQALADKLNGRCPAEQKRWEEAVDGPLRPADRAALRSLDQLWTGRLMLLNFVLMDRAAKQFTESEPPPVATEMLASGAAVDRCFNKALDEVDDHTSPAEVVARQITDACGPEWDRFEAAADKMVQPEDQSVMHAFFEQKRHLQPLMSTLIWRARTALAQ
jgi:hypothetical protein